MCAPDTNVAMLSALRRGQTCVPTRVSHSSPIVHVVISKYEHMLVNFLLCTLERALLNDTESLPPAGLQ